jgi:PPM family protein phosphatase
MQFTTAALTDLGLVRHENEDRFLSVPDLGLFAVADGIGGLPKGAEAAECAVTSLTTRVRQFVADNQTIDLAEAVTGTNKAVVSLAEKIALTTGLGCTLCAGLIRSGSLQLVNVGDSRCYLLRGGKLKLLTTDDTIEHEVEVRRARGEKVELDERYRNALTRCIGQPMDLGVTVFVHSLEKNDLLLFCSDGVSRMSEESAIFKRLSEGKSVEAIARGLIDDALAAGGHDNATVVVVRIDSV